MQEEDEEEEEGDEELKKKSQVIETTSFVERNIHPKLTPLVPCTRSADVLEVRYK